MHALYYTALSVALFSLMVFLPAIWLKIVLGWVGLSFLAVAIAYATNNPYIFRKRIDGQIPGLIRWLFVPFLLAAQIYNRIKITLDTEPLYHKVDEQLYLAARLSGKHLSAISHHKIDAIIDVTAEFDALNTISLDRDIEYLNVPILDHAVPSLVQLQKAMRWLHLRRKEGKTVLVHCALGRGRSYLVVLAYILSQNVDADLHDVANRIQSIRKKAQLNKWQMRQLLQWHSQKNLKIVTHLWLLVNPNSGGGTWQIAGSAIKDNLSQFFDLRECIIDENHPVEHWLTRINRDSVDVVVACGGDGTVAAVAEQLINSDIALAVIPAGTANALAKTQFGLFDATWESACEAIIGGRTQLIDTAVCNEKPFLLLAGLGFEQQMVANSEKLDKDSLGQLAYVRGLWQAINDNQLLSLQIEILAPNTETFTIQTPSLVIANLAPLTSILAQGGGQPHADDGLLDITWLTPGHGVAQNALRLLDLALNGLLPQGQDADTGQAIMYKQASEIKIMADSTIPYVLDGEIYSDIPIHIKLNPKSLKIIVPITESTP